MDGRVCVCVRVEKKVWGSQTENGLLDSIQMALRASFAQTHLPARRRNGNRISSSRRNRFLATPWLFDRSNQESTKRTDEVARYTAEKNARILEEIAEKKRLNQP